MAIEHFEMVCTCQNDAGREMEANIRANSPGLGHVLHAISGDFLNFNATFTAICDQWFMVEATNGEDGYRLTCDDPELGWRQMWRILVAREGYEGYLQRSEFFFSGDYRFDDVDI